MKAQELIQHAMRIRDSLSASSATMAYAETATFLRTYAPRDFLETLIICPPYKAASGVVVSHITQVLNGFIDYLEAGLYVGVSPERRAQLDVVSDFLEQAHDLLETEDVHPAAPAVLIGATLEEFLRTWVGGEDLSVGNRRPGLETYTQALRDADLITKQDVKEIRSWGGLRNHAAHGDWKEVESKERVVLMLEGVNLFMRKYSGGAPPA